MVRKPQLQSKNYQRNEAASDVSSVITILNYFHPVSEGIVKFLKEHAYSVSFNKGELLLEAGRNANTSIL